MTSAQGSPSKAPSGAWRLAAWAGAVTAMLVSFVHEWTVPLLGENLRPQRGHLLLEAWMVVKWSVIGSLLGGWWWGAVERWRRSGTVIVLLWSAAGMAGTLSREVFWAGLLVWLMPALMSVMMNWRVRREELICFLRTKQPWNACFGVVWLLVWVGCDAMILRDAPPGWIETADAFVARLLTLLVIAGGVWFLLALHERWAPAVGRWLGRLVLVYTPLVVVLNTALRMWWGKGMMEMFGELLVGGRFELERAWAAGGVELNAQTILAGMVVVAVPPVMFVLCRWFSRRRGWKINPLTFACVAAAAWIALQVDQLAGTVLKDRGWRWWERKAYNRRMTWVEPEPGLATYRVQFANPRPSSAPQILKSRPDVFVFMVESLRADALRPDIAPFLCRWRDEECQPLKETWAASNVTHQSWFSILSGRLPVFVEEARQAKKLAPLPAVLKGAGYRVEVRMVNNFDYMGMVAGNFGEPREVEVMEHVGPDHPENFFKVPEREVRMLNRLRKSVLDRTPGGLLAITGMDSTHYNYKWAASFTPPMRDYEENPIFPMRPDADEVRRIMNRFWNSVAWVDAQLGQFMAWLKEQGRYEDAIIIVTGDHGEEFKEEGSWFHGTMLNEPQTRVPMLIKWPRSLGIGRGPATDCASHLDLLPSVFDALGCDPSLWRDLPGVSLLHPPAGPRTVVLSTHFCGKNGEALLFRSGATQAAFGWRDFWTPHVPDTLWLERVQETTSGNWPDAFPDVLRRVFERIDPE